MLSSALSWIVQRKERNSADGADKATSSWDTDNRGEGTGSHAAPKMTAAERRAQRAAEAKAAQRKKQQRNLLIVAVGAVILLLVAGYFIREQMINQDIGTVIPDEGQGHVATGTPLTFKLSPALLGQALRHPQGVGCLPAGGPRGELGP